MGNVLTSEEEALLNEAAALEDEELLRDVPLSWDEAHALLTGIAEAGGDWAGAPMPVDGFRLTLESRHPMAAATEEIFDMTEAGKERTRKRREAMRQLDPAAPREFSFTCHANDIDETEYVRNAWWSEREQRYIFLVQKGGKVLLHRGPKNYPVKRVRMLVNTMGASAGWSAKAEREAMAKLQSLVTEYIYEMYELTGAFMETSKRSGLTYIFRRARPTIVMTPGDRSDPNVSMRILSVMCLHPLGYYDSTWAGAMVPTDDVVAHLMMMRGDEHLFWKCANHHRSSDPEAGL